MTDDKVYDLPPTISKSATYEDVVSQKIDEFELKGKTAEVWIVKGKLQIRYLGIIHNIPLPLVTPKLMKCEDAVSREAVLEITAETGALETQARVKALPPVNPKQRIGYWVPKYIVDDCGGVMNWYDCSECGRSAGYTLTEEDVLKDYPYCHCGAKMKGVSK